MKEKQKDVENVTTEPDMLPAIIRWGLWPLWIFAGMAICSIAGSMNFLIAIGIILGGVIGGVTVGLMPYLSQRWKISQAGWWIWALINLLLIVIALIFFASLNYSYTRILTIGTMAGTVVALITRWIYLRWQTSKAGWSARALAVGLIVLLLLLGITLLFLLQS